MHELSIAIGVVRIADDVAAEQGAGRVASVRLAVGALAGVVRPALEYAFPLAAESRPRVAGAALEIEDVPLRVHCAPCNAVVELPSTTSFRCPDCGTPSSDLVSGREIEVRRVTFAATEVAA